MQLYGGIEAGGTKFVCAIGDNTGKILERARIDTTVPEDTMPKVIDFFQQIHAKTPLAAIGISSFGPVDLDIKSPTYGYITTAPKSGWDQFDFVGTLKAALNLPIGFDTDVNGAAIGEARWGNGKGVDSLVYWTVGTGIGAGGILYGKMMHGLIHPEMGHTFIPHDTVHDPFAGICPFHGDCLEGLASGPALMERWGVKSAVDLPDGHEAWDLEAKYLGYAMANCVMTISPQKIIIGGGVMQKKGLLQMVREKTLEFLNNYIKHDSILEDIDNYIVAPGLGHNSGVCGAFALAEQALHVPS
ncbi:MAG: ROK family protein [Gammaproteobacteria bacterium]|nr:ROK family protein [Gammaproteobacteria bacterium]